MTKPSKFDNDTFLSTREHLNSFINRIAKTYGGDNKKLLEIGSQDRSEVKNAFAHSACPGPAGLTALDAVLGEALEEELV